jgi:hypothetical protein
MKRMLAVLAFLALSAVPAYADYCYGSGTTWTCHTDDGHTCIINGWGNYTHVYCY